MLEEHRCGKREAKLHRANIPKELWEEIIRDSRWNPRLKKMLSECGSRVSAKYLNAAGISAEYKDELFLASALMAIVAQEMRIEKRLDALIAAAANRP